MTQDSCSDFSIIKNYIELKGKYDVEVKQYIEKMKKLEENFKQHAAALEGEIRKKNEQVKLYEIKLREVTAKLTEKDEQLKTIGLQLHKLKMSQNGGTQQARFTENNKKKGFF